MTPGEFLGVASAGVQLAGYAVYVIHILRTNARPNTASWFIWAYGSALEAGSYVFMSGDWAKSLLPVSCSLACVCAFLIMLGRGRLGRISAWEWLCVAFDIASMFVWWRWHSATWAHLIVQAGVPVSFVPLLASVWRDPAAERLCPWLIWCAAYVLGLGAVLWRWEQWPEAVYSANYLVWTAAVAAVIWSRKPKAGTIH